MFLNDLIDFISADSSVNSLLTGGMIFDHLPTNFDADKDWIVFGYSINDIIGVFGNKNALTNYELDVQVVSKNINSIETISNYLNDHLITYPNEWSIDATLSDMDLDWSSEREVYYKTLKYNILY